jgi:hypothetical protein
MNATRVPMEEAVITKRLARQQNYFTIALALLLALIVGGYFYTVRVNDVTQLRQAQYTACQQRNGNVDAIAGSLRIIAEGTPERAAELLAAADALQKADCGDVLHR